jgi:regulator of protease activity HflC (stomatin/prohibitin superfamily)
MSTDSGSGVIVEMPEAPIAERRTEGLAGRTGLAISALFLAAGVILIVRDVADLARSGRSPLMLALVLGGVLLVAMGITGTRGLTAVARGEAIVVQLFGSYLGTIRTPGLHWVNPLSQRIRVSTRIRNQETPLAKVNDAEGNPIEIAAVVVWQVADTAQARYEVDDFVQFVAFQAETAVRLVATSYPYDTHGDGAPSLLDNAEEITAKLSAEIAARVRPAGVKVIESRITRLAYAPEIAQAMLRRQQASAVVAARKRIVEGAVGMVQMALERLEAQDIVTLDDERKATMVSNLLVVLCSDQATQPVVNVGSLYQ